MIFCAMIHFFAQTLKHYVINVEFNPDLSINLIKNFTKSDEIGYIIRPS